jgi:polyisoprenoid-binding protein YceI
MKISRIALAALLAAGLASSASGQQAVDYGRSRIGFTARQMNVPVDGIFRKYAATVFWNAARPESSRATVEIDVASFDMGEDSVNAEARGADFFDAPRHPKAVFEATGAKPLGGDRYEVAGRLTLKGVTREVLVPFTVRAEGASDVFEGIATVRRLDFRVGDGTWRDTSILANEVQVRFRLVVPRPGGR